MAHNANTEDYQRLALRHVMAEEADPAQAMASYSRFWRAFALDRDSLPQTDADRAFHLVALAANILDYQLPFAMDTQVDGLLNRGRTMLDEALTLDPNCFDARRMRFCLDSPSFDERYAYLTENKDEVGRICMDASAEARTDENDERADLASRLATYPYLRWLAALADHALVCGHNTSCLALCRELLELDPSDLSDVRFTMALCCAKAEDPDGLDRMRELIDPGSGPLLFDDAWTLTARMALAYKTNHLADAAHILDEICTLYPRAEKALERQAELPDGLFARIHAAPYSEDELILALSEATVLTQEGADDYPMGPFGMWIVDTIVRRRARGAGPIPPEKQQKRGGSR